MGQMMSSPIFVPRPLQAGRQPGMHSTMAQGDARHPVLETYCPQLSIIQEMQAALLVLVHVPAYLVLCFRISSIASISS